MAATSVVFATRRRVTKGAALLCAVPMVLALSSCGNQEVATVTEQPRPVVAFQVGLVSSLGQRQFTGLATAENVAVVSFRVPGQILSLPISVGQPVKRDDVLASIDSRPYDADVTRLEADLQAATADLTAKDQSYTRIAALAKTGAASQANADTSLGLRDAAAAQVESVRSALVRARIDQQSTVLKAPFDGRIVSVYPQVFEEVRAQQQIARVLDLHKIEAVIDVPETMISLVPLVQKVSARFDAFPSIQLDARVTEIGAEATQTTRTFPVTLQMDQPPNATILPGMAGTFKVSEVKTPAVPPSIVVPPTALRPVKEGSQEMGVWVVKPGDSTVSLRPVSVGRVLQGGIEVTKGLAEGEWVVSAGANSLTEGQRVRLPKEGPAT